MVGRIRLISPAPNGEMGQLRPMRIGQGREGELISRGLLGLRSFAYRRQAHSIDSIAKRNRYPPN